MIIDWTKDNKAQLPLYIVLGFMATWIALTVLEAVGYGWFTNIENEKLATDINQKLSEKQPDKLTISIRG